MKLFTGNESFAFCLETGDKYKVLPDGRVAVPYYGGVYASLHPCDISVPFAAQFACDRASGEFSHMEGNWDKYS